MSNKSYKRGHPCLIPDLEGRAFSISLLNILAVVVVQLLSCVQFFANPWTAARQASLSLTVSQSLLKLMSIESVMPSNHLILCCPFLLLPSIFPRISIPTFKEAKFYLLSLYTEVWEPSSTPLLFFSLLPVSSNTKQTKKRTQINSQCFLFKQGET